MVAAEQTAQPAFLLPIYLKKPGREHAPRPRNREIFEAVRVQGMSERAAAVQFKLSKTRIHQICEAVSNWIVRSGGGTTRTWGERQRLSEYLHRERLDDLYRHAREAWKNSEQVRTTRVYVEEGKPDRKVHAAKVSPGETRYLALALKTESARAKFEDDRPKPPEPDDMTIAERLREVEELVQEALRLKALKERESAPEPEATTDVSSDYDPAPMFPDERASDEEREAICEYPAEDLPNDEPPMIDDRRSSARVTEAVVDHDPEPPPMYLQEHPTSAELMRYYFVDEDGYEEWRPPTVEYGLPGEFDRCEYQPLEPNRAWQANWRKKNGMPWRPRKDPA